MLFTPIQTRFDGYKFRSKLEAKWAYFFKAIGAPYDYEKAAFSLPSRVYLCDFWLPVKTYAWSTWRNECQNPGHWIEIKPFGEPKNADLQIMSELCLATGHGGRVIYGDPFNYIEVRVDHKTSGHSAPQEFLFDSYNPGVIQMAEMYGSVYKNKRDEDLSEPLERPPLPRLHPSVIVIAAEQARSHRFGS